MAFKLFILSAILAAANAGIIAAPAVGYAAPAYAPPAVTSQSANILRSYGNLGQVSTYTKTIDTPYSSVSKSDVRVSNPGYATPWAAPAIHAPVAPWAAPAIHAPAPVIAPALRAPVVAAPAYHAGVVPAAYAAPRAVSTAHGLLGVAYSAAPAVAHTSYTSSYGIQYTY